MPIPNRIVPPGSASGRKVKLNLPRFLSGGLLSQMHLDRLNAIETLYAELSETMSAEGEDHLHQQIGRASCRESVCQYGYISVVAVSLKKKRKKKSERYTHKNKN